MFADDDADNDVDDVDDDDVDDDLVKNELRRVWMMCCVYTRSCWKNSIHHNQNPSQLIITIPPS